MSDAHPTLDDLEGREVRVPEHVVFRDMADETVLLNLQSGRYHGLDAVGARFFEAARTEVTLAAAARTLAAEFEQPVDRIRIDLAAFLTQMVDAGLVELGPQG